MYNSGRKEYIDVVYNALYKLYIYIYINVICQDIRWANGASIHNVDMHDATLRVTIQLR